MLYGSRIIDSSGILESLKSKITGKFKEADVYIDNPTTARIMVYTQDGEVIKGIRAIINSYGNKIKYDHMNSEYKSIGGTKIVVKVPN